MLSQPLKQVSWAANSELRIILSTSYGKERNTLTSANIRTAYRHHILCNTIRTNKNPSMRRERYTEGRVIIAMKNFPARRVP